MSLFYLDTSALVKRYMVEIGSTWIMALANPAAGHTIIVCEITRVEAAAAIAARHRIPGGITRQQRDTAVDLLLRHCDTEYRLVPLDQSIITRAVNLTQNRRLRGYDAIQMATAMIINNQYIAAGFLPLTFVTSDNDLIVAAEAEGLPSVNPQYFP
ncbi:MAG: type II toxin-antitoxin system VapC family toxin [Chloroflexi bacterium]|nr:type II toxin-antitoxin system VapC family toxin [Chloroflexota bacterium]